MPGPSTRNGLPRLGGGLLVSVALVALALAPQASGATQVGATFTPSVDGDINDTYLQSGSPGGQYAAPSSGVITSWSHLAAAGAQQLKLEVARPAGGNSFTIVGNSAPQTIAPGSLNSFATRISVQAGDLIGVHTAMSAPVAIPAAGYALHALVGDPAPGNTSTYNPIASPFQLDVSAVLEPDCDSDGFGDETQDPDTASCNPETTITKRPKDKTKKKRASFEFSSTIAGATFECKLDSGPFEPCATPHDVKVKKGKHSFEVRATANGHADASPATDDWKVKKKRKK